MMLRGIMHAMGKDLCVEDVVSHVLAQYHDRPIQLDMDLRRSMLEMRHADAFVLAITKELLTLEAVQPGPPPLDTRPTKDDVFARDHKSTDEVDDHPPTRHWRDDE